MNNAILKIFIGFLFLILIASPLTAQVVDGVVSDGEYPVSQDFDGGAMTVSYVLAGGQLTMALEAETEGWVAVGFDPGTIMMDADMIFGWVENGTASAIDCFSVGATGPHPPDTELGGESDITSFAGSEENGRTTVEFTRAVTAGDAYDKTITDGMTYIWAYGYSDDFEEYHDRAGYATLSSTGGPAKPLLLTHIITLSLSLIAFFTGMLIARYAKKKTWWLKTHRRVEIGGSILGLIGIATGGIMVQLTKGAHLTVPHAWIATATVFFLIATPIIAQVFLKSKISIDAKKKLRPVHRWSGRIALILMLITVVLGLLQAGIL